MLPGNSLNAIIINTRKITDILEKHSLLTICMSQSGYIQRRGTRQAGTGQQ